MDRGEAVGGIIGALRLMCGGTLRVIIETTRVQTFCDCSLAPTPRADLHKRIHRELTAIFKVAIQEQNAAKSSYISVIAKKFL